MVKDSRKIAAILAADVVEYSRLMGADEQGTLAALKIRREIFERLLKEFDGQEFGSVGDSLMAQFPSAINAVRCARNLQHAISEENDTLPADRRMALRIGVNLGDVIEENGALFGDGVNIAARLQAMAAPGGVLVSGAVYEQVKNKLSASFTFIGTRQVKNIAEPVPCYEVMDQVVARSDRRRWPWLGYQGDRGKHRVRGVGLTLIALLLVLGGGIYWRYQRAIQGSPATTTPTTAPAAAAITADARPSIAVLPFENRSDEHQDAFFVDGIHDDILTQLTKIGAMKVIARTSVEQFRDTKLTTREIGEKLGVTRVLEGGVQRAGDRVRVTVQLIDTATDDHLWAESYDRKLTAANIFAIQSEVAATIAGALKTTLTLAERKSIDVVPTQSLDAWEAYQLGKQRMAHRTSAGLAEAEKFFQKAIELDPKFALAYVGLADTLNLQTVYSGLSRGVGLPRAEKAVGTALKLDPKLAEAWASSAAIAATLGQYDRAEPMFRRAIELNPNYATAYHFYGKMLSDQGRARESLSFAERAVELDPLSAAINANFGYELERAGRFGEARFRYRKAIEIDPSMPNNYSLIGELDAYVLNRYADAVPLLEKAVELDPGGANWRLSLTWLYLDLGDDARATRMIQAAHEHGPDLAYEFFVSEFAHLFRGDQAAALQDAQRLLALEPRNAYALLFLRNADVRQGDYAIARARYAKAYPEFFTTEPPKIDRANWLVAIDLVLVLQKTGSSARASALLDRVEEFIRTIPRMGGEGYLITDVRIYALRDQKRQALSTLRVAEQAGWRSLWRYYRDFDPELDSIRNEPEFKAVFADIERDMARQRAELAARPKDAPLDLETTSN